MKTLDARLKILIFLLYAWTIAFCYNFKILFFFDLYILGLILLEFKYFFKILKPLLAANGFLVFIVITTLLTYHSPPYINLGFFQISEDALFYSLLLFLKSNSILLLFFLLPGSSDIFTLFHALDHLKIPSKLNILLFFTYRYFFSLKSDYQNMMKSAKSRGFELKTSLHTYKTIAYLLANLLIKAYQKSERVYKAMLARGFNGTIPVYRHFKIQKKDLLFLFTSVGFYITTLLFYFRFF